MKTTCPSYNAIMVLRLLWLKEHDAESWSMIDLLMDHREDPGKVTRNEVKVIKFIREYCRYVGRHYQFTFTEHEHTFTS